MIRNTCIFFCVVSLAVGMAASAAAAGLARSASKVDVKATLVGDSADAPDIKVQLLVADGWHVNAHPASLDFLVPTTITAQAGDQTLPLAIAWPDGHASGIELGGTEIMVYSDNTTIPVRLKPAAAQATRTTAQLVLKVRVQACSNKGICLPPSTLTVQPAAS